MKDMIHEALAETLVQGMSDGSAVFAAHGSLQDGAPPYSTTLVPHRRAKVPAARVVPWADAPLNVADIDPNVMEREVENFALFGQRVPIKGRLLPNGDVEAITGLQVVEAARVYQERSPDMQVDLTIDLQIINDDAAYRLAAIELEGGPDVTSYARGRFYQRAVAKFGNEAAAAKACRIHKSTIKRSLDVVRTVDRIGAKIMIHADVSQRQGEWFAQHVGFAGDYSDVEDVEAAKRILAIVKQAEVLSAARLFGLMKTALQDEKPRAGASELLVGDSAIGTIKRSNDGSLRIALTHAGDVELDVLINVIRTAIAAARATQAG